MRIAEVAPLYESVPPKLYGGTERVVSYFTEELVRQGHDVTLFASGDSQTSAALVPICDRALRLAGAVDPLSHHVRMIELVFQQARSFDVIHFHLDYIHFPLLRRIAVPNLTTLHGRLDISDLDPLYREFRDMPVVSISDAQRAPLWWANWQATVYHGLPLELYRPSVQPGEYLAFLGRISPEKRLDRAIEIAERVGMPLRVAAKVDPADRDYFREVIEPMLKASTLTEFIGEIGDREKDAFLGNAIAMIFPIDWPEPFGLAMIEAMACGTPVLAFRRGSVPEIVDEGVTGIIVDNVEEAVASVGRIQRISRRECRRRFEERFSVTRMARDYVTVFGSIAAAVPADTYAWSGEDIDRG